MINDFDAFENENPNYYEKNNLSSENDSFVY